MLLPSLSADRDGLARRTMLHGIVQFLNDEDLNDQILGWLERVANALTVPPTEPMDAHRALPEAADLMRIFASTDERVIRNDFTFRYKNRFYKIEDAEAEREMPRTRITDRQVHLNGCADTVFT